MPGNRQETFVASLFCFPGIFTLDSVCRHPLLRSTMSEYGKFLTHNSSAPLRTHDPIQEKKAARRKVLEDVERRRRENYLRWRKKMHTVARRRPHPKTEDQ